MSGRKETYIRVTDSMWNNMQRNVRRAEKEASKAQNKLNDVRKQAERDRRKAREDMDKRLDQASRKFDKQIQVERQERDRRLKEVAKKHQEKMDRLQNKFTSDLRSQEKRFTADLQSQDRKFTQQLGAQRAEYVSMFDDQKRQFTAALEQQDRELRLEISTQKKYLESKIDEVHKRIEQRERSESQQAQFWMEQATVMVDTLRQEYNPGKFDKTLNFMELERALKLNKQNLETKQYQAATAGAQRVFLDGELLMEELELLERVWQERLQQARLAVDEAIALCDTRKEVQFEIDTQEGVTEFTADIDFWTEGSLNTLREDALAEKKRLASPENLSMEELAASFAQSQVRMQQCEVLVEEARQSIIASQVRTDMAGTIVSTLEEQGWDLTDHTYEGEDERGAYYVKMENRAGDEMLTVIEPSPDDPAQNRLEVNFYDREEPYNESSRYRRYQALAEALTKEGIALGKPSTIEGYETRPADDESALDLDQVASRKATLPGDMRKAK